MYEPSLEQFRQLAAQGNLIPVTRRLLADLETPLSAYRKIQGEGESFLFESVEGGEHLGRYSFVGCRPRAVIRQDKNLVTILERGQQVAAFEVDPAAPAGDPGRVRDGLAVVERVLGGYRPVPMPNLPRFTGGAIGFLAYEFIHDIEPVVPRPPKDELGTPTLYFLVADQLIVFDRVAQTLSVIVNARCDDPAEADQSYAQALKDIDQLVTCLEKPVEQRLIDVAGTPKPAPFVSNMEKSAFQEHVKRAKDYITAGDIIQVVGSQRFSTELRVEPLEVYRAARTINPSPYMFLLELEGMALVGASPEIHVRCEDRRVEIRPIAGTRPRGATAEEDLRHEKELLADPKERAEHVMLVDLARNDLGREIGRAHV